MARHPIDDEWRDQLTLYSLHLLDQEAPSEVHRHIDQGCAVCSEEVSAIREVLARTLLAGLDLQQPPASLRERVLGLARFGSPPVTQVWKRWDPTAGSDLHVVRSGEGQWEAIAPGVKAKQLYVDPERDSITMMVRMEPGSRYAAHRHAGPEQCYVLEGDLFDGSQTFHAGDFQCAVKDSVHGIQSTRGGCLLLIVSSLHDQLLGEGQRA
jgi:anti-sigma factor ChrR (cupin superfamily)